MIPEAAIEMCKRFEGLRLKRYNCPAGFPTIGYGHRCSADQGSITEEHAEALLAHDLADSLKQAISVCQTLSTETEPRLAAVADWIFNLGAGRFRASTFRRKLAARDYQGAAAECRKWVWAGGRKLPGLILRREAEAALLLRG